MGDVVVEAVVVETVVLGMVAVVDGGLAGGNG